MFFTGWDVAFAVIQAYSGYGMEFTFKNDEIFNTFEYLYTGQTAGV